MQTDRMGLGLQEGEPCDVISEIKHIFSLLTDLKKPKRARLGHFAAICECSGARWSSVNP